MRPGQHQRRGIDQFVLDVAVFEARSHLPAPAIEILRPVPVAEGKLALDLERHAGQALDTQSADIAVFERGQHIQTGISIVAAAQRNPLGLALDHVDPDRHLLHLGIAVEHREIGPHIDRGEIARTVQAGLQLDDLAHRVGIAALEGLQTFDGHVGIALQATDDHLAKTQRRSRFDIDSQTGRAPINIDQCFAVIDARPQEPGIAQRVQHLAFGPLPVGRSKRLPLRKQPFTRQTCSQVVKFRACHLAAEIQLDGVDQRARPRHHLDPGTALDLDHLDLRREIALGGEQALDFLRCAGDEQRQLRRIVIGALAPAAEQRRFADLPVERRRRIHFEKVLRRDQAVCSIGLYRRFAKESANQRQPGKQIRSGRRRRAFGLLRQNA